MVIYYSSSIFPLLHATGTPNPFFFLRSASFWGVYNSGFQWAITGNVMLMLLLGDTFFSLLVTLFVAINSDMAIESLKGGAMFARDTRLAAYGLIAVLVVMAFLPLAAIPLLLAGSNASLFPLEVLVTNYAPEENLASLVVLIALVPAWSRLHISTGLQEERIGNALAPK